MNRLLLVRHGNIAADMSRYWGHTDVPLSGDGLEHAGKLRDRLASEAIGAIFSSDLKRALDTANIIATHHRSSVVPCSELREIDFGQCEGLTFDEVKQRYPEADGLWTSSNPDICFPGGESLRALAERVERFVAMLHGYPDDTVLIVAHGGPLRVLLCCLTGLDLSAWQRVHMERASLSIIEINDHHGTLGLLNDVSHLQGGGE